MSNPSDPAVFWPAFAAAGFLRWVLVKQAGKPAATVQVAWEQPDQQRQGGATISTEYSFEYQHHELPVLAAGDTVTLLDDDKVPIPKSKFSVRDTPVTTDTWFDDKSGYWKRATLTKQP